MLAAKNMLNELGRDAESECMNDNDDIDLGIVLNYCYTSNEDKILRFSNGEERTLSFEN